jgi:hypothetical protein
MKYLIALFAVLMLTAACAPQQPSTGTQTEPVQEQPEDELVIPTEEPETVYKAPKPVTVFDGLPEDEQALLKTGTERINTGYSYTYQKVVEGGAASANNVWQKGDTIKIELSDTSMFTRESHVDVVILNRADKTATGYCWNSRKCGSKLPIERFVQYSDYNFMTPHDWITTVDSATRIGEESLANRKAIKLSTTVDDVPTLVWIDRFSGVVMQVQQGNQVYKYSNLGLGVKNEELQP